MLALEPMTPTHDSYDRNMTKQVSLTKNRTAAVEGGRNQLQQKHKPISFHEIRPCLSN